MTKIKVSSKGQIVIPKHAREELGINAGQELDCKVEGGRIIFTPAPKITKTRHISELFGILKDYAPKIYPHIDDEIEAMNHAVDEMFRNDPQWKINK